MVVPMGGRKRIREGNARELVPLPFEPWTPGELLETALPGSMGHGEHALQRVTGNAEGLPVVGQQIMEALGGVVTNGVSLIRNKAGITS